MKYRLGSVTQKLVEIEDYIKSVLSVENIKSVFKAVSIKNEENNHDELYVFTEFKFKNTEPSPLNSQDMSDEENLLMFIWAEVLNIGRESIGIEDDFFSLGGNSAKILQALDKINSAFDISLNAAEFVKYPTIKEILKYIKSIQDSSYDEDDDDEEVIVL